MAFYLYLSFLTLLIFLMESLNIVSCNINGLRDDLKRKQTFDYFNNSNHNIILLQETHSTVDVIKNWQREWNGTSYWNSGTNFQCGVAILTKHNITINNLNYFSDEQGRLITLTFSHNNKNIQIINIYAPNKPQLRPAFYNSINMYVLPNHSLFLAGDFNMTLTKEDRSGGTPSPLHQYGKIELQSIIDQHNLVDIWKRKHPKTKQFSWTSPDGNIQSRLDRLYIPQQFERGTLETKLTPFVWSDHNLLETKISNHDTNKQGPSYWKLNTSILQEPEFIEIITNFYKSWRTKIPLFQELDSWWDLTKCHFKNLATQYSQLRQKHKYEEFKKVLTEIQQQNNTEKTLNQLKRELLTLQNSLYLGAATRSKETLIEQGETPTKFFFAQEQIKQSKKSLVKLKLDSGECTTSSKTILKSLATYYRTLYSKSTINKTAQAKLLSKIDRKLSPSQNQNLDKQLTKKEIKHSVDTMENEKSPGLDGLPVEFYKTFWDLISDDLLALYLYITNTKQELSETQKLAVISLIPKKGDQTDIANWRPISLLNVDYKILSKVLANRLKSALHEIIHPDQTAAVPNRTIFSNIFLIRDLISYTNQKNLTGFILTFDQEKAFDKIDHEFLYQTLLNFGFGEQYINMIKILYKNTRSLVINNGFLSSTFNTERGIRQGCPLSLPLYCVVAEVLALSIRQNNSIIGFRLPGSDEETKLSQYADDTSVLCTGATSINRIFETFEEYSSATGATLNHKKTKGLALGRYTPEENIVAHPITWEGKIKILGITFTRDILYTVNENWTTVINKFKAKLIFLKHRNLSYRGRTMLLNTIALTKIWFLSNVFYMPPWALKSIERAIFNFIWNNLQSEPINRKTLYLPTSQGGLGILQPLLQNNALRLKHLFLITNHNINEPWVHLARYWLATSLAKYHKNWKFLHANNVPKTITLNFPTYYQNLLFLLQNNKQITSLGNTTCKAIYKVLEHNAKQISPRSEMYWNRFFGENLPWKKLWSLNFKSFAPPTTNNIFFRLLHNIIPTGALLNSWSRLRHTHNPNCLSCGKFEDSPHVFSECKIAANIWNHFKPLLHKLDGTQTQYQSTQVMLGLNVVNYQHNNPLKLLLLTITINILQELWISRNKFKFEQTKPNVADSISNINTNIKYIIKIKHRKYKQDNKITEFINEYCINNALCSINDENNISFNI